MEKQKKGLKIRFISNICTLVFSPYINKDIILKKRTNNLDYFCKNSNIKILPSQVLIIRLRYNNIFYTLRNVKKFKNSLKTASSIKYNIRSTKFTVSRNIQKVNEAFFQEIKPILTNKIEIKTFVSTFTKRRLIKNIKYLFLKKFIFSKKKKKNPLLLNFVFEQKRCFNGCRSKKKKRKKRKKSKFRNF